MSADDFIEVDVWDWQGKVAIVKALTLPDAELVGLFEKDVPLSEETCRLKKGKSADVLEWRSEENPRPLKVRVRFSRQRKSVVESPLLAPLLSVVGGVIVAVIAGVFGYLTADMKRELQQLDDAAKTTPECVSKPNRPVCLQNVIERLQSENTALAKSANEGIALNAKLAAEQQELKVIIDGNENLVQGTCSTATDCLGQIVSRLNDQRVRLAIIVGCREDLQQESCIKARTAAVGRKADNLAINEH